MWRRYYINQRPEELYMRKMAMSFFTKRGYLKEGVSYHSGSYIWLMWEEEVASIGYCLSKDDTKREGYMRVMFRMKSSGKDFDYKIQLVATPCNFGWLRWWFLDPCYNGYRKCAVLYFQNNGYFASGKTINIAYYTQNERRGAMKSEMEWIRAMVLHKTIKYPYRNGKATRKMRRLLKYLWNSPSARGYSVDDIINAHFWWKFTA